MVLLRYFTKRTVLPNEEQCTSLSRKELKEANKRVDMCLKESYKDKASENGVASSRRGQYNEYTSEQRAEIGKYSAENGPIRAARHFSKVLGIVIPESTARRLKAEYLKLLGDNDNASITVKSLPTKHKGRPLLLGQILDTAIQDYIKALCTMGAVVNTSIVMAAAEGIVASRDRSLLIQYGGHIQITKTWAKSLLSRMGYVKRKCSNAGKVSVQQFKELQGVFLADIQAEVVMNDIPNEMIFNWDQTALQFVPTGQWTMHHAGEKVIPIANSDDKRQVKAVIAATLTGELLPPQIIYKGKTGRCHPKCIIPKDWDIWHSDNHWSTEDTMKRYMEKILVPFLNEKRADLKLNKAFKLDLR